MKRLFVAAVVCAAVLLVTAPAALAFAESARQAHSGAKRMPAPHVPRRAAPVLRSYTPLGARLAGATATVTGHLYNSLHSALSSVNMNWWSWSDSAQTWSSGQMTSQFDGSYSAVPAATTEGEIWAYPNQDTTWARRRTSVDGRQHVSGHRPLSRKGQCVGHP